MKNVMLMLQNWYTSQCDSYWEHSFGIKIETLDNPGWAVLIDLKGTDVESMPFQEVRKNTTETNWYRCNIKDNVFRGFGGTKNLIDIIQVFCGWVDIKGESSGGMVSGGKRGSHLYP